MAQIQQKIDHNIQRDRNIHLIKQEMSDLEKEKDEGTRIRSKIQTYKEDERPTSFFFSKEKRRGEANQIDFLKDGKRIINEEPGEIINIIYNFYTNLYKSQGIDIH